MSELQKRECINCGTITVDIWDEGDDYNAVQCSKCKLVWLDPIPSELILNNYYQGYYKDRIDNLSALTNRKKMYELEKNWLSQFINNGKVLDVGCSDGSFLTYFNSNWEKYGVEYESSTELIDVAHKNNIDLKIGNLNRDDFEENFFDCVTLRGVIEHFHDPRKELDIIKSICKQNGFLFITATPDVSSYCADLYRKHWNQYKPPEHIYYFSVETITTLLQQFGFKRVAYTHFYLETPYADTKNDYKLLSDNVCKINANMTRDIDSNHPFWGNLLTVLFQKI